jgi:hypothetical protein
VVGLKPMLRFKSNSSLPELIQVKLTVTDNFGAIAQDSVEFSLNNLAPIIDSIVFNRPIESVSTNNEIPVQITVFL